MSVTGAQVADYYNRQAKTLSGLIASHDALAAQLRGADGEIEGELAAARNELAAVYLPALSDEAFLRVARLTGFQGFARRDPRAAMAHERHVLETTIRRLEADGRFQRRDTLVGPSGTLTQELDLAREALAPLAAECARFEQQPEFLELIRIGYDTPAFADKWWQASYWRHWAAGDRVCKALELADFGDDVIPAYRRYAEPRDVLLADVRRLEAEITAVHELVRERDTATDRIAHLEEIYLGQARDYLGEHLVHADLALLEQWIEQEPELARPVQLGLRRLAGVQAKRRFVGEIAQTGVPGIVKQLEQRRAKAHQKAAKFARPKYAYQYFPDTMIGDDFDTKANAIAAQRDKLDRRVHTLVTTRSYHGFDLGQDQELWWLYLTGSPPPRFAPSLYDYYQRHPQAEVALDPDFADDAIELTPSPADAAEATAAAFASGDLETGAYLS